MTNGRELFPDKMVFKVKGQNTDEQVDNAVKTYDDLRERGAIRRHAMRRALETVTPSAEPPKRGCERDLHISNGGAGCGCGKIPPKADRDNLSDKLSGSTPVDSGVQPAESDAQRDTITRANLEDIEAWATGEIEAAEDRAAKRGRDEALAVVVKALWYRDNMSKADGSHLAVDKALRVIADFIERERGGNDE